MVYRPKIDSNLIFVIMPFGDPFDGYYEKLIKPVVKELDRRTVRSDELYGTGAIVADIWAQIWHAAAVIADVTGKNPNVNYELGLCHALGVPTVLMTRSIDDVPFDYRHRRCIVYDTNQAGWETQLKIDLRNTLQSVFASSDPHSELAWPYDTAAISRLGSDQQFVDASEALGRIVAGVSLVTGLLARAYGPLGHRVAVRDAQGHQQSSRNGAVLAADLRSTDPMEAIGVAEAKRVVAEMQAAVGDGTKTAAILAFEILSGTAPLVKQGVAVDGLVRGLERAVQAALGAIESQAKPVIGHQLKRVAQTAAKDETIGTVVAEAFDRVGKYGIVTIEAGGGATGSTVEVIQGIQIDRGFISDAFVTDSRTAECNLDEPAILLSEFKLTSLKELLPLLEMIAKAGRPLLIVAEDVEGEVLSTLVVNQRAGKLRVCAIRAPGYGDRRRHELEDLAALTGGFAFTTASGRSLSSLSLADLGSARSVLVNSAQTTIVEGKGTEEAIGRRIEYIKAELNRTNAPIEREKLQERLAKIAGAVAIIRPGGATPAEFVDRRGIFANAMHAAQAAIQDGWVVGGGLAGAYAAQVVRQLKALDETDRVALECVASALDAPIRHLSHEKVSLNAAAGNMVPDPERMTADGILDPTSFLSRGLPIAWSHVKSILQTGAWDVAETVTESDEDDQ